MKYLGINLAKEVKDLHNKNFKPLRTEIDKKNNKNKDFPSS